MAGNSLSSPAVRAASGARSARLSPRRADLVLVSRSAVDLDTARRHLEREYKVAVRTDAADLAHSANVTRLAEQFPAVDILVNDAGAIPGGTLFEVDEARWRTAWDLKVLGTINMTRAFYPLMKARGGGAIINIIGNAARSHDPGYICGVTGNAGLVAFTESLGSGSVRDGIRVIGVSPGPTATDRVVGFAGKRAQERFGDSRAGPSCSNPCRAAVSESPRRSPPWSRSWRRRNPAIPAAWSSRSMRGPRRGRGRSSI